MMKRILCLLLALATVFALCACGGDNDNNKNKDKTEHPEVGARTLIAAAQQESGEKSAARLVGMEDTDFGAMVKSYLGVDPAELYDGAMALSEDTAANEIIVLVPKDADSMKKLISALEQHRDGRIQSDANYFPENVELLNNARIYDKGGYAVMVVDKNAESLCKSIDSLMSRAKDAETLAAAYDEAEKNPVVSYDYTKPVPENEAVDAGWFSDAMFIGDSRMKSVMDFATMNGWFSYGADLSAVSLTVNKIYTATIKYNGVDMTIADAIRAGGSFSKCYIMLGVNELGWSSISAFIDGYSALIDLVREAHPEAQIYVIGIMPLGDKALRSGSWLTNDNVKLFNSRILEMCAQKQVYYIDDFDLLAPDGKLAPDAAVDGIHVQPEYSKMLVGYLLTHTVSES